MTHARLARIAGGSLAAGVSLIALGGWLFAIPVILLGGLLVGVAIVAGAYILFTPTPPAALAHPVKPASVGLRETGRMFADLGETELAEKHVRMATADRHHRRGSRPWNQVPGLWGCPPRCRDSRGRPPWTGR